MLFSAANLATQGHCLLRYLHLLGFLSRRGIRASSSRRTAKGVPSGVSLRAAYRYWPLWLAFMLLQLNAWLASMAFHSRDVRSTEVRDCRV